MAIALHDAGKQCFSIMLCLHLPTISDAADPNSSLTGRMNTLSRSVTESLCQVLFASTNLGKLGDKCDMCALSAFWITKTMLLEMTLHEQLSTHTCENSIVRHVVKLD